MDEASCRGESVPRYEAVCDCCMETQLLWRPELESKDCPVCGVGRMLGPWPVTPRFEPNASWDELNFRSKADVGLDDGNEPQPEFYLEYGLLWRRMLAVTFQ